jgi:hypothetical protein
MILNFDADLMWFLWLGPFLIAILQILYVHAKGK